MTEITSAFAVPMAITHLKDCEQLNDELRQLFLDCERQGDKYRNPEPFVIRNKPLYESKFSLFDWPQECVRKLRDFCYSTLYGVIRDLNGYELEQLKRLHIACESWFHVTRAGGFFASHSHPMHSWSGVYCVKHDGDDPASDSGKLMFSDPHAAAWSYVDMATLRMKPPFSIGSLRLRLVPGQLVLFPSWLLHEVLPYEGAAERITVAFNARFRMEGVENLHKV